LPKRFRLCLCDDAHIVEHGRGPRLRLTPGEHDRLLLFTVAELARARRARGLRLNVPEATALIADAVAEAARDGLRVSEALDVGRAVLTPADVLPGVTDVVREVHVEAVFDDGTRLAVVEDPFGGHVEPAPGGPGAIASPVASRAPSYDDVVEVTVTNRAEVPISVTSHFHFFEVNPRLAFDRAQSYGRHLAVPAGTAQRFEPGRTVRVPLTPIRGERVVIGFAGLVDGPLDAPGAKETALQRARACGYLDEGAES
jgi:urease subunit gamma/beta